MAMPRVSVGIESWCRWLRFVGIAEGISYLALLFIAMPLKYGAGYPIAVEITGAVHGGLFLLYVVVGGGAAWRCGWRLGSIALIFLASIIPFGPFLLDARLRRIERQARESGIVTATPWNPTS